MALVAFLQAEGGEGGRVLPALGEEADGDARPFLHEDAPEEGEGAGEEALEVLCPDDEGFAGSPRVPESAGFDLFKMLGKLEDVRGAEEGVPHDASRDIGDLASLLGVDEGEVLLPKDGPRSLRGDEGFVRRIDGKAPAVRSA